jgi:hypothetical protein
VTETKDASLDASAGQNAGNHREVKLGRTLEALIEHPSTSASRPGLASPNCLPLQARGSRHTAVVARIGRMLADRLDQVAEELARNQALHVATHAIALSCRRTDPGTAPSRIADNCWLAKSAVTAYGKTAPSALLLFRCTPADLRLSDGPRMRSPGQERIQPYVVVGRCGVVSQVRRA